MNMTWKVLFAFVVLNAVGCGTQPTSVGEAALVTSPKSYSSDPQKNLRISLTDAPARELKNVFVNIEHVELFIRKNETSARVRVGQGLGMVDLLTLRNGVLLPIEDVDLAPGVTITQIRLVLNSQNNHSIRSDDSRCEMQTPSAQRSGIKIHLSQPVTLEQGRQYSMVLDFDAGKSVVVKGNGDCLLKPVLKLMQVTSIARDDGSAGSDGSDGEVTEGGGQEGGSGDETAVTDGNDQNGEGSDGSGDGFDAVEETSDPPVITIEDSYNIP